MADGRLPALPGLVAGQVGYQVRLLTRTPRAAFGAVVLALILLALREQHADAGAQPAIVAGLAVLGAVSTAYVTHTNGLVAARDAGVLKRWRATPLPYWCLFAGRIGATVLLAVGGGLATVTAGALLYGTPLPAHGLPALVAILTVGAAAWSSAGTALSGAIPSTEAAWPLLSATYLPLMALSGAFGSVGHLPEWLSQLLSYLPADPLVDGVRRALAGGQRAPLSVHDLAVLAAWAVVGLATATSSFRWATRPPGRRRRPRRDHG